jgi:hypothetical protein
MNVGIRLADTGFELDDTRRKNPWSSSLNGGIPSRAEDLERAPGKAMDWSVCSDMAATSATLLEPSDRGVADDTRPRSEVAACHRQ